MSFNPNQKPVGPARKAKRVSDVNALGGTSPAVPFNPAPPVQQQQQQQGLSPNPQQFNNNNMQQQSPNNFYTPETSPISYGFQQQPNNLNQFTPQQQQMFAQQARMQSPQQQQQQMDPQSGGFNQQFAMFQQPMVQDMAMQYGQKLADQGKEMMNKEFEKYIPVTKLKYYFAVDNKYVLNKLRLLFFPFAHKDWSLKYDQENPVQPRYDINAPDLYIPAMAYITYVVLAGFILGMQERFSPEQLGIQASSALAYNIFELIIYTVTLYVSNIQTTLRTLDLVAFSGYKYASIVAILCSGIMFPHLGYWLALCYCGSTLAFFLLRTLKAKVLSEPVQTAAQAPQMSYDPYGQTSSAHHFDHTLGRKRKLYFLFLFAILQFFLPFMLTKHLI